MTNGSDLSPNCIIGKCYYCKKPIENMDRFFENSLGQPVHLWCSKSPNSKEIKKI